MTKRTFKLDFAGKQLIVETGEIAKQADGSVLVRYDDTVILTTAVGSNEPKNTDFFHLTVVYEEKQYSVGKIPGSFHRREGRPGENATLTARLSISGSISSSAALARISFKKSTAVISFLPRYRRIEFKAAFKKFIFETPGISTGY